MPQNCNVIYTYKQACKLGLIPFEVNRYICLKSTRDKTPVSYNETLKISLEYVNKMGIFSHAEVYEENPNI